MEITRLKNSLYIIGAFGLMACSKPAMFDEFVPVTNGWHQDSIIQFEVAVTDTVQQYYPSIKMRHNADYPYTNIYLFRKITSSSGVEYQDTVDLILADDKGKWLGEGIGEIKTMEWGFGRGGLRFTHQDKYTFSLQQGMRDSVLAGVMDVGLEIQLLNEEKADGRGEEKNQ